MKNAERVAIVLHGENANPVDLRAWCAEAEKIVAADGAADVLLDLGITPNFVIGDMDSIRADTLRELGPETVLPQDDQNTTDFQKCLAFCKKNLNAKGISVLNFEGSRVDHMLSALFFASAGVRFVGSDAQVFSLGEGEHAFPARRGTRISLIPMPAATVSEAEGLLYDPVAVDLRIGGRDGISNEATTDIVRLTISSGSLLAFVQRFEGEPHW